VFFKPPSQLLWRGSKRQSELKMMEEQLKRSGQQHFSVGFGMGVGKVKLGALVNEILSLLANDFPRTVRISSIASYMILSPHRNMI
jgi:hypothetical protein